MELIMMIGLQACGKSTFARSHFEATHAYISRDLLRHTSNPARQQRQLIEDVLRQGRSVVVDNTHPTREVRSELIHLGQLFAAEVTGYYFAVQLKQSLEYNRQRAGEARVPDVAIFATLKKLTPPSYVEGFTRLFYVQRRDDWSFAVSAWQEENSSGET
jgi:predicted kinase